MFTRLRETYRILSAPAPPKQVDFRFDNHEFFDAKKEHEKNRVVVRVIDALIVVGIGYFVGHWIHLAEHQFNGGLVGAFVAAISFFSFQFLHPLIYNAADHLQLGRRLSPYFGRRISKTYRILKS